MPAIVKFTLPLAVVKAMLLVPLTIASVFDVGVCVGICTGVGVNVVVVIGQCTTLHVVVGIGYAATHSIVVVISHSA